MQEPQRYDKVTTIREGGEGVHDEVGIALHDLVVVTDPLIMYMIAEH